MGGGREGRDGVGDLSRDGGAQGRLQGRAGSWLCLIELGVCRVPGRWMGLRVGPVGGPIVQRMDPAPPRVVAQLVGLAVLAEGHPGSHRPGNTHSHKTMSSWPKTTVPSHLGREDTGASLPPPSLAVGTQVCKEHLAMPPAPLQARSQQWHRVSHFPEHAGKSPAWLGSLGSGPSHAVTALPLYPAQHCCSHPARGV